MRRKCSLDGLEKAILVISALLIPITVGIGIFKVNTEEKENYVSVWKETSSSQQSDEVSLKQKEFTFQQNASLDLDSSAYFDGSVEDLKQIELNLDDVDMAKPGTYKATAIYKKKPYNFTIKVEKSDSPTITAEKSSFKYIVGPYSTMDEVKDIANVTATDKDGKDITKDIVGWTDKLPAEYGEKNYTLSVTDTYGNVGYLNIVVNFEKVRN